MRKSIKYYNPEKRPMNSRFKNQTKNITWKFSHSCIQKIYIVLSLKTPQITEWLYILTIGLGGYKINQNKS